MQRVHGFWQAQTAKHRVGWYGGGLLACILVAVLNAPHGGTLPPLYTVIVLLGFGCFYGLLHSAVAWNESHHYEVDEALHPVIISAPLPQLQEAATPSEESSSENPDTIAYGVVPSRLWS
jgi:hypothetical protein